MFSSTMMASSITIPTASVSPNNVIELSVKFIARIRVKAVMMEVGMASDEISTVRQSRKNMNTTTEASREPMMRCSSSASTEARM